MKKAKKEIEGSFVMCRGKRLVRGLPVGNLTLEEFGPERKYDVWTCVCGRSKVISSYKAVDGDIQTCGHAKCVVARDARRRKGKKGSQAIAAKVAFVEEQQKRRDAAKEQIKVVSTPLEQRGKSPLDVQRELLVERNMEWLRSLGYWSQPQA